MVTIWKGGIVGNLLGLVVILKANAPIILNFLPVRLASGISGRYEHCILHSEIIGETI